MGKVVKEHRILVGGVETPHRKNELIIVQDITDEQGHGVYIDSPGDGQTSDTTAFGSGHFAEIMADKLFEAVKNFHEDLYCHITEPKDIGELHLDHSEYQDDWVVVTQHSDLMEDNFGTIDEGETHTDGLEDLMAFILKWGDKSLAVK